MLPWNLAVYRVRNGKVMPIFRDLSSKNWEIAQEIIDTFKAHVGKSKRELYEKLEEITITPSYRFVKGLIRIMDRRTIYENEDAFEFRKKVFRRFPEDPVVRAKELGMSVDEMQRKMLMDINPIIVKVLDTKPNDLIKEYNLALAQTMLFRAPSMEITFSENRVYSALKYFGLLYTMPSENRVFVDGPVSIFSHTTRYGTRFARILPFVVAKAPWSVKASLKLKDEEPILELDHLRHGYYFPKRTENMEEDIDIRVQFCKMERFERPVKVGKEYFLPEYRVMCRDKEFFVEIFRFWSVRYMERKARIVKEQNFPIVFLLQKDGNVSKEKMKIENALIFTNGIRDDILIEAAKMISYEKRESERMEKRIKIGDKEVSKDDLEMLRKKLENIEDYHEAERIIENEGLPVMETLHYLGFRIIWKGLEPHKIKIMRKD